MTRTAQPPPLSTAAADQLSSSLSDEKKMKKKTRTGWFRNQKKKEGLGLKERKEEIEKEDGPAKKKEEWRPRSNRSMREVKKSKFRNGLGPNC
jgi:hypothetical protein